MHELLVYPGEVLVVWARSRGHGHISGKSWPPDRVGLSSPLSVRTIYLQILQSIVLTICMQGVCIGLNAAIVSIVSEWLSDIKMGYCSDGWWLNQQFCCWEIEGEEVDGCDSWHTWSHITLARWFIFVIFAVSRIWHSALTFLYSDYPPFIPDGLLIYFVTSGSLLR